MTALVLPRALEIRPPAPLGGAAADPVDAPPPPPPPLVIDVRGCCEDTNLLNGAFTVAFVAIEPAAPAADFIAAAAAAAAAPAVPSLPVLGCDLRPRRPFHLRPVDAAARGASS